MQGFPLLAHAGENVFLLRGQFGDFRLKFGRIGKELSRKLGVYIYFFKKKVIKFGCL